MNESPDNTARELAEHLAVLAPDGLPKAWFRTHSSDVVAPRAERQTEGGAEPIREAERAPSPDSAAPEFSDALLELEKMRAIAQTCTACRLCEQRNKVVFGVGKADRPLIAFVGEGPGADEDRVGEPFVGKAGQLLTAAITKGMGLRREDVYICNVVKCRPPQNRAPLPDETEACTSLYLYRQLELLSPQIIVTLGQPAQLALSGVAGGITRLRGQWQTWRGTKLMPTFHPAYILRNPAAKKDFWADLQAVMAELGIARKGDQ